MKKILTILLILLLVTGCSKKLDQKPEEIIPVKLPDSEEEQVDTYKDLNETPIGIYRLEGNKLVRLHSYSFNPVQLEDIGIFQIFPSNEEEVYLNRGFGYDFYDTWTTYNQGTLKIGFNLKYSLEDGTFISHNIMDPNATFDKWEYLLTYLYDDYRHSGESFYSHIEPEQNDENTLYTALKIQCSGNVNQIQNKIEFTVFTYDDSEDFDENNEYRGNSSYKINLCMNSNEC